MPDGRRVVATSVDGPCGADLGPADGAGPSNDRTPATSTFFWVLRFIRRQPGRRVDRRSAAGAARVLRRRRSGEGMGFVDRGGALPDRAPPRRQRGRIQSGWGVSGHRELGREAKIVDRSGRVIRVLRRRGVVSVRGTFSPDGRLVATAARIAEGRYRLKIWDWERGVIVRTISATRRMDFDPSGSRIATAGQAGHAEIWDVESGTRLAVLAGNSGASTMSPSAPTDRASPPRARRHGSAVRGGHRRAAAGPAGASDAPYPERGLQPGRYEARLHERVRWCSDLGPRHRRPPRDRPGRSRDRSPTRNAASTFTWIGAHRAGVLGSYLALPRGSPNRIDVATVQRSRSVDRTPGAVDPTLANLAFVPHSSRERPGDVKK